MGDFDEFEEFEDEYDEDEFDTGEDAPVNSIPESFAKPKSMADIRSKLSGRPLSRPASRPSPADEEDEYDEDGGGTGAPGTSRSGVHKETDVNSPYSYIYDGDDEFGDAIETYAPAPSSAPYEDPDDETLASDTDYGYIPAAGLSEPSIAPVDDTDDGEDNPYDFDETLDIGPDAVPFGNGTDFSAPPPPRALSYDFAGTDGDEDADDDGGAPESGAAGPMYDDKGLGKLANALVGLFMK